MKQGFLRATGAWTWLRCRGRRRRGSHPQEEGGAFLENGHFKWKKGKADAGAEGWSDDPIHGGCMSEFPERRATLEQENYWGGPCLTVASLKLTLA